MHKSYILIKDSLGTIVATTNEQGKIAVLEVPYNIVGNIDEILKSENRIEYISDKIDSNKSIFKENTEIIDVYKRMGIKYFIFASIAIITLIFCAVPCSMRIFTIIAGEMLIVLSFLSPILDAKKHKKQNAIIELEQEHLENELEKYYKEKQLLMNDVSLSKNVEIEYNKPIEIDNKNTIEPINEYAKLIEFYMNKKNLIMKWAKSGKLYDKLNGELDEKSMFQIREWISDEMDSAKKGRVKKAK